MPSSWIAAISASVRSAGHDDLRSVAAEVLALEVVELAGREHDLAGQRCAGPAAAASLEDRDLDLAADDRRLDEHLVVLGEGELRAPLRARTDRRPSRRPRSTRRAPASRTPAGRARAASARTPSGVASPARARDRDPRRDRDAGGLQHDLHEVLVHAQRGVEHTAAGVRDARACRRSPAPCRPRRARRAGSAAPHRRRRARRSCRRRAARAARGRRRPRATGCGCRCRRPRAARSASSANLSGSSSSRTKTPSRVIPTGITR